MDFADVRRLFPGATERVFLDAAAVSLTSTRAAEAVARFVELVDPGSAARPITAGTRRGRARRPRGSSAPGPSRSR